MPKSRKSVSKTSKVSKKSRQPSKKSVRKSPKVSNVSKKSASKASKVSKKSRQPSKKSVVRKVPTKEKAVAAKVSPKNDKWCDGLLNDDDGVLSSVKSQSERARILQDFDDGAYGPVHQNDDVKIEFSDWSDLDGNGYVYLPHLVVKKFFEKAKEPLSLYKTFTFSSLIYEEISAHAINFISDLCGSIFAKRQPIITAEVVMMCMNILPLQLVMTHPIIPHDKFKFFFKLVANEVSNEVADGVDDNAFHLLHNLFEHYLLNLCKYTLIRSTKNNSYVQPFHVQSVTSLFNDFKPVALSSNPLSKIQKKSNFENLINQVLKNLELPFFERGHGGSQIPSGIQFRREALSQLNQIMNAIAKELVDISIYMMEHFSNMKNGSFAIESAVRSLLPSSDKRPGYASGELVKHALSEGKKAVTKGANFGDEIKIDRLNGLNRESVLFFRGVIEYIIAEIVELAGRLLSDDNRSHIEPADIKNVVMDDEELSELIKKMKLYFVE